MDVGRDAERALRALNQQALQRRAAEQSLGCGVLWLVVALAGPMAYTHSVARLFTAENMPYALPSAADESLQSIWGAMPSWAVWFQFFMVFSLVCLGWGAYSLYTLDQSGADQLDLTDEQRRLLGLDPLRKKPFVPLIVNKPPPRFEMPPDPREVPSTPVPERIVRPPWSDLTPTGPLLGMADPMRERLGAQGVPHGSATRRPPSGRLSQRPVSFGGSADKRMRDMLEDYRADLASTPSDAQAVQLATISPSVGLIKPYRESPVGARISGAVNGSSPTLHLDRKEWVLSIQRMGLSEEVLEEYTGRLREYLSALVKNVLRRYDAAQQALEMHVPRELLMRSRNPEEFLNQVADQQGYVLRLREYRSVCKIIEEGYNWQDQRDYVLKRLAILGEGAYLSSYDWNAGGVLHDRGVTVQTPTDPDIIMHVFLTHLDSFAEHRSYDGDQPVIRQYFLQVPSDEETPSLRGRNLLLRQASSPPHFDVVESGVIHRVDHSKRNALYAMVLFLYLARRNRWLALHNPGYRSVMESVLGSVYHPNSPATPKTSGVGAAAGAQARRISF